MKFSIHLFTMLMLVAIATAHAQEPVGNCEIVARVNGEPISKADYLIALQAFKKELAILGDTRRTIKTDAEIEAEFNRQKPTVLESMISKLLLEQRAKELQLEADEEVQAMIEDPCHGIDPGYCDLMDMEQWERVLKAQGISPEQARAIHARAFLSQYVIRKEVLIPIYNSLTAEDRQYYYEQHKEEFVRPAEAALSEVLIPFESQGEARTLEQARELLAHLRAGGDFAQAAEMYTPATYGFRATGGQLGSFRLDDLRDELKLVIPKLSPGEFVGPIQTTEGYIIIRLDKRMPPRLRDYDDPDVQHDITMAIVISRSKQACEDYIVGLRARATVETCLP